jgi:hypothetical protein
MIQGIANLLLIVDLHMVIQNSEIHMTLCFKILQVKLQEILQHKLQIRDQSKLEITRQQTWYSLMLCLHSLLHLQLWLYMTNLINSKGQLVSNNFLHWLIRSIFY